MKRAIVACAISIAIWPLGNKVCAQGITTGGSGGFGLTAGGVGVTGQFRGTMSSGVAIGAVLQLPLPPRWLALRADLMYLSITNKLPTCSNLLDNCLSDPGASEIASGGLAVVARLNARESSWSPYIVAGVATYHVGHFLSAAVAAVRTNPFGWQGGIGIEVRSSKRVFFAESKYMTIAPGGVVPVVIGMRF